VVVVGGVVVVAIIHVAYFLVAASPDIICVNVLIEKIRNKNQKIKKEKIVSREKQRPDAQSHFFFSLFYSLSHCSIILNWRGRTGHWNESEGGTITCDTDCATIRHRTSDEKT